MAARFAALFCIVVFSACLVSQAEEKPPLFSGPQKGEKLPALNVTLVYGKQAGETVDFIEKAANRPTLIVIVNGANRPNARLTRILMNFAEMHAENLFAGVVYLDQDQSAAQQYLKQTISWWKVQPSVGVSIDGAEGPGSYGLNRNVNLTILVAHNGRVTSNFALIQPSETDAAKILKEVVALAGGRVPGEAEVLFLSVPTHKPPSARWRSAPADVQLRELICDALATQNKKLSIAAVENYVSNDKDRQAALGNAAAILLEGRTRIRGNPLVKQLQIWRSKYDAHMKKKRP